MCNYSMTILYVHNLECKSVPTNQWKTLKVANINCRYRVITACQMLINYLNSCFVLSFIDEVNWATPRPKEKKRPSILFTLCLFKVCIKISLTVWYKWGVGGHRVVCICFYSLLSSLLAHCLPGSSVLVGQTDNDDVHHGCSSKRSRCRKWRTKRKEWEQVTTEGWRGSMKVTKEHFIPVITMPWVMSD